MKNTIQKVFEFLAGSCAVFTIVVALFFIGLIFYVALPVFQNQGLYFLYGDVWSYGDKIFGIRKFIAGTIAVTAVTIIIAFPISLFTAIFLAEYAPRSIGNILRPMIELLVGIPSVVYGLFGLFVLQDVFKKIIDPFLSTHLGFIPIFVNVHRDGSLGVLLASTVLAIMILPTIITIAEDSLRSVPYEHREASFALGANQWQTIRKLVLPEAFKGIMLGTVLGIMRAMGETMAIVMLLGNIEKIPTSLMDVGYAMTSKILNDFSVHLINPVDRSALFGVAAVLFFMEIIIVGFFRKLGRRHI